jgi:uncharacterized protein YjiS (DUF1127 family)
MADLHEKSSATVEKACFEGKLRAFYRTGSSGRFAGRPRRDRAANMRDPITPRRHRCGAGIDLSPWQYRFRAALRAWCRRSRGRKALRELAERSDHHLLRDIGLTREEALRAAAKWFWQR